MAPSSKRADGSVEKKSVGRPAGQYGSYKIDKAARDTEDYKKNLSAKVVAAKAEGFQARDEFKRSMHAAIMKKQLELAGINPDDHAAAIEKKLPKSKV